MPLIAVFQPILDGLKRIWPFWNLKICILISLSLQVILLILAPFRKRTKQKLLFLIVWVSYLLSDWIAAIAIGIIFKSRTSKVGDVRQPKIRSEDFMPMWASFLLLHLGGPDTITSFAIADNQLWLRHLASLLFQVFSTAYIVYLSFLEDKMRISTVAVFVAGTIKYSERTRALFLASLDRFGRSVLPEPDAGPNYEDAVNIYASTSAVDVPPTKEETPTERAIDKASAGRVQTINKQFEIKLIQEAHRFFENFKGLIVGYLLSSKVRRSSRRYFKARSAEEAFRLLANELGFIYDVLHTKVVVVRSRSGYALRVICVVSLMVALFEFRSIEGQYRADYKSQVRLSYTLFFGALGVEAINVLMFVCSDWNVIKLKSRWSKFYPNLILKRQRWSMSFSRYDMISYCWNRTPDWLLKLSKLAHLAELVDKMNTWRYSYPCQVEEQLQEFIFDQLKNKGTAAETLEAGIEACKQKGDGPLGKDYDHLQWSIKEYQYAESLLLWHVATEICYERCEEKEKTIESSSQKKQKPEEKKKKICKQISDYMFYLLVMHPALMAPVLGNWQIAFQDTREEAKRFFQKKKAETRQEGPFTPQMACKKAFNVDTPHRPAAVKGSKSKSVFFDAVLLAKQLWEVSESPWTLMSEVWMELMSYAAINCSPNEHAQQPSTGGELLTFVWLLMNHFGLGTQFYEHEVGTRTAMVSLKKSG